MRSKRRKLSSLVVSRSPRRLETNSVQDAKTENASIRQRRWGNGQPAKLTGEFDEDLLINIQLIHAVAACLKSLQDLVL